MKKLLLLGLIAVFLCNCTKEKAPDPDNLFNGPKTAKKSRVISMDSLQNLALKLPNLFTDKTPLTRSGTHKMIQEVLPLSDFVKRPTTRSGEDNSIKDIYVVNYYDQQGFAIISADTCMEQVLAYSDQGNITESTDNPGLKIFMDMIPDYAQEKIRDSTDWPFIDGPYENEEWTLLRVEETDKGPYVPLRWGQWDPLNRRTPGCSTHETGRCPIGCIPLAMIHIMAAHGAPQVVTLPDAEAVYGGTYTLKWDAYADSCKYGFTMTENLPDAIPTLSNFALYVGRTVDARYYCKATEAKLKDADYALRAYFGFQTDHIYSYHWDRVKQDIDNGRPLIVSAYRIDNWIGYSDGHCWVIDGIKEFTNVYDSYLVYYDENGEQYDSKYIGEIHRNAGYWVHCNWGWDSMGDGYYSSGVFNLAAPERLEGLAPPADIAGHYYRYKMEVIKNIRR